VDVDTFVGGCLRLKGNARSMDLQALIASDKRAFRLLEQLTTSSSQILATLLRVVPHIRRLSMPHIDMLSVPHERHPCDAAASCSVKTTADTKLVI